MHNTKSEILPETQLPKYLTEEAKAQLQSHSTSRLVWGEGNPKAPVFVVLDNPGARENKDGSSFLCGTRQTLQQAVLEAGFRLEEIFVTYLLKSRPLKKYDKVLARQIGLEYLRPQIIEQDPKIIFCLGNVVVQAYFGDEHASVKELRGQIYKIRDKTTLVSYHPLAVRRRPVLYKYFLADWLLAKAHLNPVSIRG